MRINELPSATSVAQNDVLAIDTSNGTYQVPRSVLAPSPYIADIPASQWSGSSGDYYITVSASNVTPSSILIPNYDENSSRYLIGALWCVPGTGSFTIHTSVLPASTVKILVYFLGIMGEAQYQVLSDVYSKSQTDSLLGAKVNTSDIVDNLTTTVAGKVLDARQGKALSDAITQSTASVAWLPNPQTTLTNTNLNTVLTAGTYNADVSCSNKPSSIAGKLLVSVEGNYVRQIYHDSYDNNIYTRVRVYYNGAWTWTEWETQATTKDVEQSTAKYITIDRTVTSYGNTWISYSNDGKRVYAFVPDSDSASYDYYVFYSKGEQRYFVHLQTGAGVNAPDGTVVKGKAYYFD